MLCQYCRNLEQAFEARRREYVEASTLATYSVSKKFAAYMNVEMERALIEFEEHRSVCRFAVSDLPGLSVIPQLRRKQPETIRIGPLGTVA
jgi:hypothetical protein